MTRWPRRLFFYEGGRRVTCLTQVSGTSTQPATRHDSLHKAIRGQSFSHGCGWRLLVSRHKDDGVARSDSTPSFTNRRYKVPPDGRSLVAAKGKMPSPRVPMKVLLDFFTPSHSPPSPLVDPGEDRAAEVKYLFCVLFRFRPG